MIVIKPSAWLASAALTGLGAVGLLGTPAPAAAAVPFDATANYGVYMGASAGKLLYNEDGLPQMSPTIGVFQIGQQFNTYLGIEGRIGTSVSGGSAYPRHINAQAVYGGYIKGTYPFTPLISGYALAGLGGAEWHRNYSAYDSNDIGLSFGFGAELSVGGNASIHVEWMRLTSGTNVHYGYSADTLMFGVDWRLRT